MSKGEDSDLNGERGQVRRTEDPLMLLGKRAGGCTESCSEMHTFSWPCEQAFVLLSDLSWWQRLRLQLTNRGHHGGSAP